MKYQKSAIALDYLDCKQSAIYFDYVIPFKYEVFETLLFENRDLLLKLLPPTMSNIDMTELTIPGRFDHYQSGLITAPITAYLIYHRANKDTIYNTPLQSGYTWGEAELMSWHCDSLYEQFLRLGNTVNVIDNDQVESISEEGNDIRFTLVNLKLIDSSKMSWEHIVELRQDKESLKKLRDFRLFFYENYSGKPKSFIEDDIQRKMDEYEAIAKNWGIDLKLDLIDTVLESKSLLAASVSSFFALLYGQPYMSIIAGAGGAALELGKMGIKISKAHFKQKEKVESHPFNIIFNINNKV